MLILRRSLAVLVLSIAGSTSHAQGPVRAAAPRARVDWHAFLGRHDLVWERLPTSWGESAFIGNGRIGATIDVQDGALGWTINRTDVVHDQSRFPIGRVVVKTAAMVTGGTARLTLWDAEATGAVTTDRGEVRWKSFVAREPSAIVIVLDGRGGEAGVDLEWMPAEARPPRKVARREPLAPTDLHPAPIVTQSPSGITSVQSFIGGDAHAESIRRAGMAGGARVFYVGIGYGGDGRAALGEAQAATRAAERRGLGRLVAEHRQWWHGYYPASFVSFPDARLEAYYWIQVYKLGAAMRADGPILDLNGPWFRHTPWPAIWWNLNIQLTYSPLFRANRLDLAESLFRNLDRGRQALIANVPERLRDQAAAIGRSSGPDLVRPVDLANAASDAAHEMGNLPWTMYYYWLHYRYQLDDRILRDRFYPLLRLAIGNYLAYVERGPEGRWHLPATHSPELATVPDANYDLALLSWGLETLIASAERLRIDDPLLPRWRDVLKNLTPFPSDSMGLMVGRGRPWKESHRHYSHLLAVYPLGLISPAGEQRALIETSLATWERESSLFRGYSFTGGASMHALLGHGDVALTRLNQYLDAPRYMEPNTFYAESGPVIETPFSAATSVQELFLQDWGGALRVFPAVPAAWREAAFDRLRADGAFLVSAVRRDGRTAWVRIESLAGAPCRLVVADWDTALVRAGAGAGAGLTSGKAGEFVVELAKGASVVLAPDANAPLPEVVPVALPPSRRHPWPALKDVATMSRGDLAALERDRVVAAADRYLREPPVTITAFPAEQSAGGSHDYYSEGDYWWPDPADPGGPYIRRDGETNPDNFVAHRDAMRRLSRIVPALVAAYQLTSDERYARHAAAHVRAWFVDERTRMNPHLLYGQAIKGRVTGRGTGIIDTIHLVEVARAVSVLEQMGALGGETLAATKQWFRQYLEWITTHSYGIEERNSGNNHGAAWALQVAAFAHLVGDEERLASMRRFFQETLIPGQMAADGSFPRELGRTKPYGYSLFQLDLMATLAVVLSTPATDLWTYTTSDGRGMRKALAFMYPFIKDKRAWPKPPDVMHYDHWPIRHPALLFGGLALHEPRYLDLWKTLDPDPAVDEVIRNYPIRQPLLWIPSPSSAVPQRLGRCECATPAASARQSVDDERVRSLTSRSAPT
jgi:alpha-L-fucosidase 2